MPFSQSDPTRPAHFRLLWAASRQYSTPQLLGAFSDGLVESMPEEFDDRCEEAIRWFLDFGDLPRESWKFWTTREEVAEPPVPAESDEQFREGSTHA